VTITAYDATGGAAGSGHALSTETLPVTIQANTTTVVNFVLNGIVDAATILRGTPSAGCSAAGTYPLTFEAYDAAGNIIVGPGSYSDAAGDALTFTLTTTDTSGESTFSNGTITGPSSGAPVLNWSGGVLNYQTINATVSGGTIPGSITPAIVSNTC
jgi:hypothetical protein